MQLLLLGFCVRVRQVRRADMRVRVWVLLVLVLVVKMVIKGLVVLLEVIG